MYRMMFLPEDLSNYFRKTYDAEKNTSVFGSCDERGFLAVCFFDETKEPAEIKKFVVFEKNEENYWVENLIRAVLNHLDLNGHLFCDYCGTEYINQFKICRFAEKDGKLVSDIKAFFSCDGCKHG